MGLGRLLRLRDKGKERPAVLSFFCHGCFVIVQVLFMFVVSPKVWDEVYR